jgi:hypothetical protein
MTPRFRQQRSVTVVAIAAAAVLAVLLSGCGIVEGVRGRQVSTVGEVEFSQQLVIPRWRSPPWMGRAGEFST